MNRVSVSSNTSTSSAGPDDLESLGDVYIWGQLWQEGVSTDGPYLSKMDVLYPKPLESEIVLDVHNISCGVRHLSLVTRQGEVFTWGEESGGRLGHGSERDLTQPQLVEFLSVTNVDFVACGEYHTSAISTSGDLFTWGDGSHTAGLLGQGSDASHWIPKRVSGELDGLQVLLISCGSSHSAIITSTGRLFTFGDGKFGVLGHGNRESYLYPKEVVYLRGVKTIKVACGVWHTAAIVETESTSMIARKLFSWGDGDKYRLGHQNKETYMVPTCVSALVDYNFHQVACGHTLTVALTTSGHVFTMGGTAYGQLGIPNSTGKNPCLVKHKLVGEFVEEIACGANHVVVLTSRSEVFTWGKGGNGQLGHGDIEDRESPTMIDSLKDRHVKNIACGSNFTSCICIHKWVSGADQSICCGCRQAFGFTRKRHNCYNCGLVHCHACSSKKAIKAALAPTPNKPHRVCDACYNKLKSPANFNKKTMGARRSVDLTANEFTSSSSNEPVKYADVAFPSSLITHQGNMKSLSTLPHVSRLSSSYARKPAAPSSSATPPLNSRGAIDSLKKSNESLSDEVTKLQQQNTALKQKCKAQNDENKRLMQCSKEALTLASRCKIAKEIITLVTSQLEVIGERLPSEICESVGFKAMKKQAENFLEGSRGLMMGKSNEYSDVVRMGDIGDDVSEAADTLQHTYGSSEMQEMLKNSERILQDTSKLCNAYGSSEASTSNSRETQTRSSPKNSTVKIEKPNEATEQFEPGVYVTVLQLRNGPKIFKRVRFSRKKFSEEQAGEWWQKNKERVLNKYPTPQQMKHSSSSKDMKPHPSSDNETD